MVINNKKNFIYKENFFCIKYYTLSELIDIQNGIISTIEKYKKNNLNDEIINYLNNENSKTPITETKKNKQGLYLISQGKEFFKIGVTMDIKRRVKEIKANNPSKIKVLFFIENIYLLEKILHLKFDNYRINNEWFNYDESIFEVFKIIQKNKDILSKIECKDMLKNKLDNLMKL